MGRDPGSKVNGIISPQVVYEPSNTRAYNLQRNFWLRKINELSFIYSFEILCKLLLCATHLESALTMQITMYIFDRVSYRLSYIFNRKLVLGINVCFQFIGNFLATVVSSRSEDNSSEPLR